MKVRIEKYIQQVVDGVHYKGYVRFSDFPGIEYDLVFGKPIPQFDTVVSDEKTIRGLFKITIGDDDALSKEQYDLFLLLLVPLALEFYHDQQTRDAQEGSFGQALNNAYLFPMEIDATIGRKVVGEQELPPELFDAACSLLDL